MDGMEVSVMGWSSTDVNVSPWHPSLMSEKQSYVYQSQCVLARLVNILVFACPAMCPHSTRHSESGIALGMMLLQSSHLIHAQSSTMLLVGTVCLHEMPVVLVVNDFTFFLKSMNSQSVCFVITFQMWC